MKTTHGMQESNGIRRSPRIIAKGLKRVYYLENHDGIAIESSFMQSIAGSTGHNETGIVSLQSVQWKKKLVLSWGQKKNRTRRKFGFHPSTVIQAYPVPGSYTIDSLHVAKRVYRRTKSSCRQSRVPRMTIHEPRICMTPTDTHKQQLSTQGNFISIFQPLGEPDTLQEMDNIDQDICVSPYSCENIDVAHLKTHPDRRLQVKMSPNHRHSGTSTVHVARSLNAATSTNSASNILCQAANDQDQERMHMGTSLNLQCFPTGVGECPGSPARQVQNQEQQAWICTRGTYYPSNSNVYPTIHRMHDQRATYTDMMTNGLQSYESYDTETMQSFYTHRLSDIVSNTTEYGTVAPDFSQRHHHSIQQGVPSSTPSGMNSREKRVDMTCPQVHWSTSTAGPANVQFHDTIITKSSAHMEPVIKHTPPTACRNYDASVMQTCLLNGQFDMQSENSSSENRVASHVEMLQLASFQHSQFTTAKHFTNRQDRSIFCYGISTESQCHGDIGTAASAFTIQRPVSNATEFSTYYSNPYAVQNHFCQRFFTSNLDLLRQLEMYEVNMSMEPSCPEIQNNIVAISHDQFTSIKGSVNLPEGTDGSSPPGRDADANNRDVMECNIKNERFSDVPKQIRNVNEELRTEESTLKQRKKKIRCRVLKDKTKPRGFQGQPPGKRKSTTNAAHFHRGEKAAETETLCSHIETLEYSSIENFNGNSMVGLVHNLDKCAGDGAVISTNEKETSTDINGLATSHPGLCELIDFLGLSDEKHHVGEKLPTKLTFIEDHPLHASSSTYELPGLQQSSDDFLPLCLFSGETTSTKSSDSTRILPFSGESKENDLQLVLCNQTREVVVSRSVQTQKKVRAKVQLDPESHRVWLQLENGGSLESDNDPEKVKHWEKERQDMRKRVEFFIEKMHFVQGDRRFSPWKGSIVDSVVGAFLTQNVSDHLSSSAFMAVASRFPPKTKTVSMQTVDMHATPFQQYDRAVASLTMKINIFSSTDESYIQKHNSYDSDGVTESVSNDVVINQVYGYSDLLQNEETKFSTHEIQNIIGDAEYDDMRNAPLQTRGKFQKQDSRPSDAEKNPNCTFDINDDESTIEDVSATFQQKFPSRNSKVCRMLQFDDVNKQNNSSCSILETNEQVSFALCFGREVAPDNISDQPSETESVIASSSSVQTMQDSNSNLQLTTTQDIMKDTVYQTAIIQENEQGLHTTMVKENTKKRPLSISSMSGIERAQLEANQKGRKKNHHKDWESIRRELMGKPLCSKEKPANYKDSVDWDAVRLAELGDLAETIKERGMHHVLSGRIKAFLTSLHEEHGSIDLEWLRNLSTENGREYLMSIHGLGVKSVECIRLLTLHHLAFPVDTNVGRICVRLGWVPIEPLPEEVQLHLVELYPVQETIQKYLWPRLCTLDQRTLYELHYQLITFGKVFCTKSKPNCNACPMRTECKHFASAYASAKPLLTGPTRNENDRICSAAEVEGFPASYMDIGAAFLEYPSDEAMVLSLPKEVLLVSEIDNCTSLPFQHQDHSSGAPHGDDFYVEMPASPEQTYEGNIIDLEDIGANMYIYNNHSDYSLDLLAEKLYLDQSHPSSVLNNDRLFSQEPSAAQMPSTSIAIKLIDSSPPLFYEENCFSAYISCSNDIISTSEGESTWGSQCNITSDVTCKPINTVEVPHNAIVAMPEAAQIPTPKLKNIGRLRTIHYVYELPDNHDLLKSVDPREKDDPCSYLLAIWVPGETPESQKEIEELCRDDFVSYYSNNSSGRDETVAGTLLIPCRTAMRGSFPLNGTYFQVNEVFADHESSLHPLQVPRSLIWNLRRRFVYFGTSIPNIFKGLSTDEIKDCFWRGHVCVRGFDRQTRAPKPLVCRLHFPISKQARKTSKNPKKKNDE